MRILRLAIAFLLASQAYTQDQSTNHMNGPGNVVVYGTGNVADGRDNTFRGDDN